MRCAKCGSEELHEVTIDQDPMGNDLHAIICFECDEIYDQQEMAGQCLHMNIEVDCIDRQWCIDCGDYLGERR